MRLLLATGDENLNGYIKEAFSSAKIRECLYREAVPGELARWKPDVAVISEYLPGSADFVALARQARYRGARVVFILDSCAKIERKELIFGLISCGVYDLVFAPAPYEEVAARIREPASFKHAVDAAGLRQMFLPGPDQGELPDFEADGASISEAEEDAAAEVKGPLGKLLARVRSRQRAAEAAGKGCEEESSERPGDAADAVERTAELLEQEDLSGGENRELPEAPFEENGLPAPAFSADVYVLGADVPLPGAACFADREELVCALATRKPKAVVISAEFPQALDLVRELRSVSRLYDVAIGILGPADGSFFAAGADESFERLDGPALERLLARRERLLVLWQQANTDSLTGLYMRRFLDGYLEEEFRFYREHGVPFSAALIDLDRFKVINDTYGHSAGDEVLRKFGDYLRRNLRDRDVAVRYGGEEIALVLPGTGDTEARRIVERLRRGWEAMGVYGSTFSAGVAQAGRHGEDPAGLLEAADRALYAAKRAGRNRVAVAGEDAEPAPQDEDRRIGGLPQEGAAARGGGAPAKKRAGTAVRKPDPGRGVRPAAVQLGAADAGRARVVAVASPWARGTGASTVAALLARILARGGRVAAVDCDFGGGGLGVRFGLSAHETAANDWRRVGAPVHVGGVAVYPLGPGDPGAPGSEAAVEFVAAAAAAADWVVLDLGADLDAAEAKALLAAADALLWVVTSDPLVLERARSRWSGRPAVSCREAAVLFGPGDPAEVEEALVVPCIALRGAADRKGMAALVRFLRSEETRRGLRVMAVGFSDVPRVEGIVWDALPTAKAAMAWLSCHRPEMAVIRIGLVGGELVEYDLRKAGVPVYRLPDLKDLKSALEA